MDSETKESSETLGDRSATRAVPLTGFQFAAVTALLVCYYVMAMTAIAGKCTTFDELFHLTGGYSYWLVGDFRIQPENGNLPQRWAAIPLLFCDTKFPETTGVMWRQSHMGYVGQEFFYKVGNDAQSMLFRSRAMMALFGVALGALIFISARTLLGNAPAFVSLALFAFCPTMLANGPLITSDMAATLFFFASMLCVWRTLQKLNWRSLLTSALVMGCLFLSKFNAILIVPFGLVLIAIQLASSEPLQITFGGRSWLVTCRWRRAKLHAVTIVVHAMVVWTLIWSFYNFRFDTFAQTSSNQNAGGQTVVMDQPQMPWTELLNKHGAIQSFIGVAKESHFLPEAFLYGFAHTLNAAQYRLAFFNGEYSITGWRTFFPFCFLVKTPIPLLMLLALSAGWLFRTWRRAGNDWSSRRPAVLHSLYSTAPLWVLFVGYWLIAITSHLNIGHRHILPTYPAIFVFAGASWNWMQRRQTKPGDEKNVQMAHGSETVSHNRWFANRRWPAFASLLMVCVAAFASESLWRWPNYLAYFNQLIGGPQHAYRHLVDSSLDWGQDLPALRDWLSELQVDGQTPSASYISYFGTGSPQYYNITARTLVNYFPHELPAMPEPLMPGVYCISATMLQNIYTEFPGHWCQKYEDAYQQLDQELARIVASRPEERTRMVQQAGTPYWQSVFFNFEQVRLARLTCYLRRREPDHQVNYSIMVYVLSSADLNKALVDPPAEMFDAPVKGD
jgi:4-amino-4-deoxy-L-arabinose transferase-like glycosyltransferase